MESFKSVLILSEAENGCKKEIRSEMHKGENIGK